MSSSDSFSGYLTADEGDDETENTQYLSFINPDPDEEVGVEALVPLDEDIEMIVSSNSFIEPITSTIISNIDIDKKDSRSNLNRNIRDLEKLNEKSKSIKPSNVPLEAAKKTISVSKRKIGFEYKYECEKCQLKFINQFLLKRHHCVVKPTQTREICRKKFPRLKDHNKNHEEIPKVSKANTVKNTRISAKPIRSNSKNADKSKGAIPKIVMSKTSNPETTTLASERTFSIPQSSAASNKMP